MPAAAVIPAPIAYIKVVAVKKLVVGFQAMVLGSRSGYSTGHPYGSCSAFTGVCGSYFYFEKIRVFKAGCCLNTLAWNNGIGL